MLAVQSPMRRALGVPIQPSESEVKTLRSEFTQKSVHKGGRISKLEILRSEFPQKKRDVDEKGSKGNRQFEMLHSQEIT
jgi:hypothetical protein